MAETEPLFIDVEASSLRDGFPVEVGWCSADLLRGATYLIRPPDDWVARLAWSREAQDLHTLTLDRLRAEGLPPDEVAARLAEDLAGVLHSDNPAFDGGWLGMLFEALPFRLKEIRPAGVPAVMRENGFRPHYALDDAVGLAIGALSFGRSQDRLSTDEALERGRALIKRVGRA